MSGLARAYAQLGMRVSGSDSHASSTLEALQAQIGGNIYAGHDVTQMGKPDVVVYSAAIPSNNPELAAARAMGIDVVDRAEMLGRLMSHYKQRIAVAGTHGKTTTSAMIALMLEHAGADPTALIGGDVLAWGSNTRVGAGDLAVAEACEAFGSFLHLSPTISVVTNIEADHLDYYGTLDNVVAAFHEFVSKTSSLLIYCADDPLCRRVAQKADIATVGYGSAGAQTSVRGVVSVTDGFPVVRVANDGEDVGVVTLSVPGVHNAQNALAAVAVGLGMGIEFPCIAQGIAAFRGTGRRFETLGTTSGGAVVIDDYAHHPTEIGATMSAARMRFPDRRLIVVFQPHLPSRVRDHMAEFATAFQAADLVIVTDIYLAREEALPGVTGEVLAEKMVINMPAGAVRFVSGFDAIVEQLSATGSKDVVLVVGAGDIRKVAERLVRDK